MHTSLSEPSSDNVLDKRILPQHVGLRLSQVISDLSPVIGDPIGSPSQVFALCASLARRKQEALVALYLDSQMRLLGRRTVSVGDLNTTRTHPREILYPAIKLRALGFVIVHNHPSGTLVPSSDDIEFTRAIARAAEIIGVALYDHVIVSRCGYTSLKEKGLL